MRAVWNLGDLPGCKVRADHHRFGIQTVGDMLFKISCAAAGVWFFYALAIGTAIKLALPIEVVLTSPIVVLVAIPTLVFIIGAFVICQIPLHQRMVDSKRAEILRLQSIADELVPSSAEAITDDMMRKRQFVETQLDRARSLPEWPFTRAAFVATALSAALSAAPTLIVSEGLKTLIHGVWK